MSNLYKVALCKKNKVGVIYTEHNGVFYGVGFDGKPWQSKCPSIIANSIEQYFESFVKNCNLEIER